MTRARTGLLVVRAWFEEGSSTPLRLRVRATTDVSSGFETSVVTYDPAELQRVVDEWLDGLRARAPED